MAAGEQASSQPRAPRKWRAPRESGEVLLDPPLNQLASVLAQNRQQKERYPGWLNTLAAEARPALLFAAAQFTSQYRNVSPSFMRMTPFAPAIFLSGHQPQLFHAGVWFKNFVLSSLAQQQQAVGINLIVDNDTLATPAIRVPAGDATAPRTEFVPFDATTETIPFEERQLIDPALFASFAQRVRESTAAWFPHLLLDELWPLAQQALSRSQNLGLAISAARHRLETNWGLDTLEVPLSTIYSQVSFHRFLWQLLCDLPRFRESYNGALQDFRAVNHVRSRSHPVPDLAAEADWLEAPFWIWSREQPRRQRLFVRRNARGLELTDRHGITIRCGVQGEESLALEQFAALEKRGIKLRPRALLTTMYARLVLSDLFIHGIGGAKYDELTDAIIQHYFALTPPHYLTATATLTLPVAYPKVSAAELLAHQQAVRTVEFHAETLLREHPLAQRKQALLAALPPRGARRAWHAEMATVQAALQAATTTVHQEALAQLSHTQERYRYSRLLHSREFSFCLFPTELIRSLLLDLCRIKS